MILSRPSLFLAPLAALMLAGCGDSTGSTEGGALKDAAKGALGEAMQIVDESQVAELLSAEAKFALGAFEQDLRGEIAAYQAQFGRLPTSLAELKSMAAPQELAVATITDALAEQLPYVRRETLEQIATRFVTATQERIFAQITAGEAPATGPEGPTP